MKNQMIFASLSLAILFFMEKASAVPLLTSNNATAPQPGVVATTPQAGGLFEATDQSSALGNSLQAGAPGKDGKVDAKGGGLGASKTNLSPAELQAICAPLLGAAGGTPGGVTPPGGKTGGAPPPPGGGAPPPGSKEGGAKTPGITPPPGKGVKSGAPPGLYQSTSGTSTSALMTVVAVAFVFL